MVDQAKEVIQWIGRDDALVQLLEPLFLYGIGIGLLFFALCFFFKQEVGRKIGLAVIIICCALIYPYLKFSEKVLDDVEKEKKFSVSAYQPMVQSMKAQYAQRYNSQWCYYALGGLASVSLLLSGGKAGNMFSVLTLLGGLAVVSFGLYMDMRDKKIHYDHMFDPYSIIPEGEVSANGSRPSGQARIVAPKSFNRSAANR